MDMKPIDSGIKAGTPVRAADRIEFKQDGTIEAQAQILATTDKVEIKKKKKTKDGFLANTAKTILSGVGLGSGLVGGGIIGAGLGATGSVISGLAGSGLTWASLGTGGMIGGIAGAVIFGAAGTYGGWTFATALIKSGRFLQKLLFTKEPLSPEQQASLDRIKEVEDNPKEATKALNYMSRNLAVDENLEKETDVYLGLLNHFTNKKSDAALSAYATLKEKLSPGDDRSNAVSELGKFSDVFKSPEEAMDALYGVLQNLKAKDSLTAEGDKLRAAATYLKQCTPEHALITPELAGQAYMTIKNSFPPDQQKAALDATLGQFTGKKQEPKDVLTNLKTVLENRQKGDDLAAETKNLMGLNDRLGSDEARTLYVDSKKTLPPGDERNQVIPQFDSLSETFGNAKDAQAGLRIVLAGLNKNDSFTNEVGAMKKIVEAFKAGLSSDTPVTASVAGEAYTLFKTNFSSGERDEAVAATLGQFGKQSPGEALKNLNALITSRNKGDDLKKETQSFHQLLEKFDNNGTVARNFYAATRKYLPPGEERAKALGEYENFTKTFATGEQAMEALFAVLKNLNQSDSLSTEAASFRKTADFLKAFDQQSSAATVADIYAAVKKGFAPKEREEALKSTFGVFAEGNNVKPADAVENFKTILATRRKEEDLAQESSTLLGLTKDLGGNGDMARKAYTAIKESFSPGDRDEARANLLKLAEVEKSPEKALASFAQLNKSLHKGESLSDAIKEFSTIHGMCESSSSAHDQALAMHQVISKNFEKGSERDSAMEGFKNLLATFGSTDAGVKSAVADFNFVYTHMSKGEKIGDELNKYIALLKSNNNNSSAAQTAYVDSKYEELWGK